MLIIVTVHCARLQEYWDLNYDSLKSSGSWCGLLESYILELSTEHLPNVVRNEQIDALFSAKSVEEQRKVFEQLPIDRLEETIYWYIVC